LNRHALTREAALRQEQRGCLHANMDLYKWAFKLAPYTPSALVADCFALAWDIREIDMRASPYELTALGFEPLLIETEAGKEEYRREQQRLAALAEPVRQKMLAACQKLVVGEIQA
jgi:hypothetical protein